MVNRNPKNIFEGSACSIKTTNGRNKQMYKIWPHMSIILLSSIDKRRDVTDLYKEKITANKIIFMLLTMFNIYAGFGFGTKTL